MSLEEKIKINEKFISNILGKIKKPVFTKRVAYGLIFTGLTLGGNVGGCEIFDEPDPGCGGNETTCGPGCMPKGAKCCNSNGTGDYCSTGNCGICNDGYGNYYNCCV